MCGGGDWWLWHSLSCFCTAPRPNSYSHRYSHRSISDILPLFFALVVSLFIALFRLLPLLQLTGLNFGCNDFWAVCAKEFPYECRVTHKVDTHSLSTGQHQPLPKSLCKAWTKRSATFPPRRPARLIHTCDCQVSFGFLNLQCSVICLTFRQCENSCGLAVTKCVQPQFMAHWMVILVDLIVLWSHIHIFL